MGQVEDNDIRGFQLSRQTRILYRIRDNKIIILSFFDVRQDPKKELGLTYAPQQRVYATLRFIANHKFICGISPPLRQAAKRCAQFF
jgi:hypothetical protein